MLCCDKPKDVFYCYETDELAVLFDEDDSWAVSSPVQKSVNESRYRWRKDSTYPRRLNNCMTISNGNCGETVSGV